MKFSGGREGGMGGSRGGGGGGQVKNAKMGWETTKNSSLQF